MLQFELSLHAAEQIKLREISQAIIFDVVNNPDTIREDGQGQHIYQKIVLFENNSVYLVRVFVNSSKIPNLIKTAYRTSNFSKYI